MTDKFIQNTPISWETPKLEELALLTIGGDWGKDPEYDDENFVDVNCIRGTEFRDWDENKGSTASHRKIKRTSLSVRMLVEHDILVEISGGGPEQPVGRTVLIDKTALSHSQYPKICTNFFRLYRPSSFLNAKYLNLFLNYFYKSGEVVRYQAGSNNLRNLKFNDYLLIRLPFPPLNEQHRIVAKIEELFSEIDKGVESLKTAKAQLQVYRQALLKHAFEGKLTAQWRSNNPDKVVPAAELLRSIEQAREERYQQQLTDWQTAIEKWEFNGKEGKKPSKPQIFNKPEDFNQTQIYNLCKLPHGWKWVKLGMCFDVFVGSTPRRNISDNWSGEIPWISSGEVNFKDINTTKEKITKLGLESSSTTVHPPGTVMLAMIGEGKTRGQAGILKISASHNQNTAAIRVLEAAFFSKIVFFYLQYQYEHTRTLGSGNNQKALSKHRVSEMAFPLFSKCEQSQIMELLDRNISTIDYLENVIEDNLTRNLSLKQSILKKAFSGQLVPQDSNDEPASELLKRIQSEKVERETSMKKQKVKSSK